MTAAWRCFVAVPIGADLRDALAARLAVWRVRPELDGLRWADPVAWHVTLAFLGATDPAKVDGLVDALHAIGDDREPMTLDTGGLGGFPSAGHAKVAWYGIADPERRMRTLAKRVRRAVGAPEHQPFRPHLTLARARIALSLSAWIGEADAPDGTLHVDRLHLMRSHLGRGPATYETLATVPLEIGSRV